MKLALELKSGLKLADLELLKLTMNSIDGTSGVILGDAGK